MTDAPRTDPHPSACGSSTRRQFLSALGASVAVGAVGGYGLSVWGRADSVATPETTTTMGKAISSMPAGTAGPSLGRTLVVVEMGGGNDGLNMVVPHATDAYYDLRGNLGIRSPLDLDGEVGLHPNLNFLADEYTAGRLAIVEGVGYPDPNLSHFASMATWWSGVPASTGQTGWLGRYLDGIVGAGDPLAGVSIGPGPTPALAGEKAFVVTVQDMTGLAPTLPPWIDTPDELFSMWKGFAPAEFDGAVLLDQVRAAIGGTVDASNQLSSVLSQSTASGPNPQAEVGRRRGDLTSFLEVAAALIVGPNPPKVIYVHGWGDFDVHEGHAARHGDMMAALNEATESFFATVRAGGRGSDTMILTTSEFGRRPLFNGSGTDHGTAAAHLLIGEPVTGGRYGQAPSLTNLDARGNLAHTVDYRSLYASVLSGYLLADAQSLLGGNHELLPLFA